MINRIDLRVNGVSTNEINKLRSLVTALADTGFRNGLEPAGKGQDFVLTMQPASLPDIKKILHDMLRVVPSERIAIET